MDIVESKNLKVPNCVLISGPLNSDTDREIYDFLKLHGSISRVEEITDEQSDYHGQIIVEFEFGSAMEALEKLPLPYHRACEGNPEIVHHIHSLSAVYAKTKGTASTKAYLDELTDLAKLSGRGVEEILREELSRISDSVGSKRRTDDNTEPLKSPDTQEPLISWTGMPVHTPVRTAHTTTRDPQINIASAALPTDQIPNSPVLPPLTTPDIQRVVVEHVVKSSELVSQMHSSFKLKPFSGRVPHSNLEVDYETWRSSVEFYLNDPMTSDSQVVKKIMESLSLPASTIVKPLGPLASAKDYLDMLDSAYATVEDGDELFARFLNINQNSGEKPSEYLHRLQTALNVVVRRNGIPAHDSEKQLLKQFCRGCWDSTMIVNLQLEQRKSNPPPFPEFLLILRTEEDKQATKTSRMRQHLGFTKVKAQTNLHNVCSSCLPDLDQYDLNNQQPTPAVDVLQKQIATLQVQVANLMSMTEQKTDKEKITKGGKQTRNRPANNQTTAVSTRPKPWYCFTCGEDGHISASCSNTPNPSLVQAKKQELKERQRIWDMRNGTLETPTLK
ncbi:zinc finger CCHC domain-containing protein 18-like [Alosa pseudoharengus]|uniref:zinc finger CCHC domain-containing protein 18-like n=1 Tax=Alosa pseudoharengus TaxID=34774 RepID=UPI003F894526